MVVKVPSTSVVTRGWRVRSLPLGGIHLPHLRRRGGCHLSCPPSNPLLVEAETEGWREEEGGRRREREREARTGQNVVFTSLLGFTDLMPQNVQEYTIINQCIFIHLMICLSA